MKASLALAVLLLAGNCGVPLAAPLIARAQEPASAPAAVASSASSHPVTTVDLFGYSGWDGDDPETATLRDRVHARVGQEVKDGLTAVFRRKLQGDVIAVTGEPATDIALVCCDRSGGLAVFVGVQGKQAHPLEQRATPTGADALPPEALTLYLDEEKAASAANAGDSTPEDTSQGYALSADPATRSAQEKMRAFAVAHADVILQVLRRAGAVQQRQAAAELLGYAQRTPAQMRALLAAVQDDDERVRGSALHALTVLARGGPLPAANPIGFIGLLYSGIWSDRDRAGALLVELSKAHDPKLLKLLREQALPPLIEGARWHDASHAYPFAMLLARAAGMPDERAQNLLHEGKADEIVRAGVALRDAGATR